MGKRNKKLFKLFDDCEDFIKHLQMKKAELIIETSFKIIEGEKKFNIDILIFKNGEVLKEVTQEISYRKSERYIDLIALAKIDNILNDLEDDLKEFGC
jgi:hypothetical protein